MKDCHDQQLSLCVPLLLGRRPATEWLSGLEYAVSYSLASALSETYLSLPALLKGMEVLTELQGTLRLLGPGLRGYTWGYGWGMYVRRIRA